MRMIQLYIIKLFKHEMFSTYPVQGKTCINNKRMNMVYVLGFYFSLPEDVRFCAYSSFLDCSTETSSWRSSSILLIPTTLFTLYSFIVFVVLCPFATSTFNSNRVIIFLSRWSKCIPDYLTIFLRKVPRSLNLDPPRCFLCAILNQIS